MPATSRWKASRIVHPIGAAKIHPGEPGEKSWQRATFGHGGPWQQHRHHAKARLGDAALERAPHLFVFPRTQATWPDEDRAGARGVERLFERLLPRLTGHEVPFVQPGSEVGLVLQPVG